MKQNKTFPLILSGLFIALAVTTQYIGKAIPFFNQILVGSIINAILISSVLYCGVYYACLVSLLTPITAFLIGVIPSLQGPFVPFICIGNLSLVVAFSILMKLTNTYKEYIGIIVSAIIKFIFLFISAQYLIELFGLNLPEKMIQALKVSMGIMQFITALIGGTLAILINKMLKKRKAI